MTNRRRCEDCGSSLPSKCLPFLHSYERVDEPGGYGIRTVRCKRCGFEKTQQHFGRGVWL